MVLGIGYKIPQYTMWQNGYHAQPHSFHHYHHRRGDLRVCPQEMSACPGILGEHVGSPLHTVVQWFKTMATNEYIHGVKSNNWSRFNKRLWQRNYYEHIIRNENEYNRIEQYIINNPKKWNDDQLNETEKILQEPHAKYGVEL